MWIREEVAEAEATRALGAGVGGVDFPFWHWHPSTLHDAARPLADFLRRLDLRALARLDVALEPYSRVLCGEAAALCTSLRPGSLRVTRPDARKKLWRAELGDVRWTFAFPQRVAGPVLSELLDGVASTARRVEADAAFCDQLVRRARDLPPFPCFEEFVALPDAAGRLPRNSAEAEDALRRAGIGDGDANVSDDC